MLLPSSQPLDSVSTFVNLNNSKHVRASAHNHDLNAFPRQPT